MDKEVAALMILYRLSTTVNKTHHINFRHCPF
jgi:hypothetical protein